MPKPITRLLRSSLLFIPAYEEKAIAVASAILELRDPSHSGLAYKSRAETCESARLHHDAPRSLSIRTHSALSSPAGLIQSALSETMQKSRVMNSALGARSFAPAPRVSVHIQRRNLQDVAITRTGKPIVRVQGGRLYCDCFRRYGFPGPLHCQPARYVLQGDVAEAIEVLTLQKATQGCTVVVPYREEMAKRHLKVTGDLGRVNFLSIEESVRHSDIVYNLVGRGYPTKRGEEVVRKIYPETTIVRPAPMFGFEDNLLHKLAGVSNLLTANHMQERYWPVHVCSLAAS
ncbi:hypothetical protein N7468_010411 [Penicillium chermesinum]|uniref:NmrA-like domain-containing protein n=1 Tax=Penicillium chermesinum TaxID=63820 RepID=A0A9W9NEK6_9EURO|nr:uncharacterized protein N7468_010411 [Penicillium chermesinum]KAJ5217403.1 hypothetical protein N7468_010411 [Penicillium chermesinum]